MPLIITEFILEQVSNVLFEPIVRTQINPSGGPVSAGIQTISPGSMQGIYQGVQLVVGSGGTIEVVTVISLTATTFTANFTFVHAATDPVVGATFPSGQPTTPLWTQSEMINYLISVQNDFLSDVRPVYAIATQALTVGKAIYPNPADAVRVERISIDGSELWNTTQTDIDWQGGYSARASTKPQNWYQDKVGAFNFAVDPAPQVGMTARLFYSQVGSASLGLLSTLTVPDIFWPAMKAGVLACAWSKDGEQKDLNRSAYCQKRFEFWCLLAKKFLEGMEARFRGAEESVEPALAQMKG